MLHPSGRGPRHRRPLPAPPPGAEGRDSGVLCLGPGTLPTPPRAAAGPGRPSARSSFPTLTLSIPVPGAGRTPRSPSLPAAGRGPGRSVSSCHMARGGVPAAAATPAGPGGWGTPGGSRRGFADLNRGSVQGRPGERPTLPVPQGPVVQKERRGTGSGVRNGVGQNRAAVLPRGKTDLPPRGSAIAPIALPSPPP